MKRARLKIYASRNNITSVGTIHQIELQLMDRPSCPFNSGKSIFPLLFLKMFVAPYILFCVFAISISKLEAIQTIQLPKENASLFTCAYSPFINEDQTQQRFSIVPESREQWHYRYISFFVHIESTMNNLKALSAKSVHDMDGPHFKIDRRSTLLREKIPLRAWCLVISVDISCLQIPHKENSCNSSNFAFKTLHYGHD